MNGKILTSLYKLINVNFVERQTIHAHYAREESYSHKRIPEYSITNASFHSSVRSLISERETIFEGSYEWCELLLTSLVAHGKMNCFSFFRAYIKSIIKMKKDSVEVSELLLQL